MEKQKSHLIRVEQRLADLMEDADVVMWEYDPTLSELVYVSERARRLTGYPAEQWLTNHFFHRNIIHPQDQNRCRAIYNDVINQRRLCHHQYRARSANGEVIWVDEVIRPVVDDDDNLILLRGIVRNSDAQHQLKSQLLKISTHDDLTGLPNRSALESRLRQAITNARRSGNQVAMLFLDLDNFKDINNSFGHEVGDKLLVTVADRLRSLLRSSDTAARFSGDSFCILIDNLTDELLPAKISERCLQSLTKPVQLDSSRIYPRASIGIAVYPRDGATADLLMQAADNAMFAAKDAGRHRFAFYNREMTNQAQKRLHLENDLRKAIIHDELVLHYQPQISLLDGSLTGVEALVRWQHPERGLLSPNEFIPLAERNGLIVAIGEWVIKAACQQFVQWQREQAKVQKVAINLSSTHFCDQSLLPTLNKTMRQYGITTQDLVIEITEAVTQSSELSRPNFDRLKQEGFRIAIDDFGTGYSCLSSLSRLPIDCLKIDRTFVQSALSDPRDATLVATIMSMGRTLGFSVIAEGIETLEQVEYLFGIGCETGQGFYFSRPVEADKINTLSATNFLQLAK